MCVCLCLSHTQIHFCVSVGLSLSLSLTHYHAVEGGVCVRVSVFEACPPPSLVCFVICFPFLFPQPTRVGLPPPFLLCKRSRIHFVGNICVTLTLKIETKINLVFFYLCPPHTRVNFFSSLLSNTQNAFCLEHLCCSSSED